MHIHYTGLEVMHNKNHCQLLSLLQHHTTKKEFIAESTSDLAHYILPNVMLWSPIQQHVTTYGVRPVCMQENCAGSLVIKCWKMGQTHSLQPHILHDCKCTVLLVAALYSCPYVTVASGANTLCSAAQNRILKRLCSKCFRTSCTGHDIHTCQAVCAKQETASLLLQLQQLHHQGISTDGLQQSTAVKIHWFNMSLL